MFTLKRRTAGNLAVELKLDVGTSGNSSAAFKSVRGLADRQGFKATLIVAVSSQTSILQNARRRLRVPDLYSGSAIRRAGRLRVGSATRVHLSRRSPRPTCWGPPEHDVTLASVNFDVFGSSAFCAGHGFAPVPVVNRFRDIQRHHTSITKTIDCVYGHTTD